MDWKYITLYLLVKYLTYWSNFAFNRFKKVFKSTYMN